MHIRKTLKMVFSCGIFFQLATIVFFYNILPSDTVFDKLRSKINIITVHCTSEINFRVISQVKISYGTWNIAHLKS